MPEIVGVPELAGRLKAFREAANLSQQELAVAAGLSISIVSHLEQGRKTDPRISTLLALARVLAVPLQELLGIHLPTRPSKRTRSK